MKYEQEVPVDPKWFAEKLESYNEYFEEDIAYKDNPLIAGSFTNWRFKRMLSMHELTEIFAAD